MDTVEIDDVSERREEREAFWSKTFVPVNEDWQENGFDFVNPVVVADMFASATSIASLLAQEAEVLTEQLAHAEVDLTLAQRQLSRLRRSIFAEHFSKLKVGAKVEVQDAFIIAYGGEENVAKLYKFETALDDAEDTVFVFKARLKKVERRLKVLQNNMEWAEQFLNYEKLLNRITDMKHRT